MPNRLDAHVLTVDANVIHQVDTTNSANLYSMWTVFSRCSDSVEQGQRLENLSWRIWQKEQLVESTKTASASTALNTRTSPQIIPFDPRLPEVPQLSGSVESVADADETIEFTSVSAPVEIIRPYILRQDSSSSARGSKRQTSPEFEKMIVSIVHNKAPLSAPHPPTTMMHSQKRVMTPIIEPSLHRSGSTSTESQSPSKDSDSHSEDSHPSPDLPSSKTTTVVRGFSTSQSSKSNLTLPAVFPAKTTTVPEPTASPAPKMVQTKKQPTFTLGASYSSSEQGRSLETRKPLPSALAKKDAKFSLGGSSEEEGSMKKKSLLSSVQASGLTKQHKQASFSNHVTMYDADEPDNAIESDSEYIDESAIDDEDDSSDWEDSVEDSGKSSVDDKYFQRVDSKVNLTSRRSLITLMIAQSDDRARNLGGHASQSTPAIAQIRNNRQGPSLGGSPNDSDDAPLMMKGARQPLKSIKEVPRSSAQPIAAPTQVYGQAALSPRTTRRNMLSTELTESLRRHLLWERSQKSSTANAVLKRRHTSHDVANLKQYPEKACIKQSEDVNSSSWNQYFAKDTFDGYHSKGW